MEKIEECIEDVKEILNQYGLKIVTKLESVWNKKNGFDTVSQYVYAGDDEVYAGHFSVNLKSDVAKYDGYGTAALSACLSFVEDEKYQAQTQKFKFALDELMELKKNHKFTKTAEKKELREKCEKLCYFVKSSAGSDDIQRVNVALLEDNLEKIKSALEKLKLLESQKQAETAQAVPANE